MNDNEQRDERLQSRANQLVEEWLPPYHTEQDAFRVIDKAAATVAALEEELRESKPRTITTVEELDALPEGSVIHSGEGAVFEKCHSGWIETGRGGVMDPEDMALPATVIHEPTTEATK